MPKAPGGEALPLRNDRPTYTQALRALQQMKLRHVYNLAALKSDAWWGDIRLTASLCGVNKSALAHYLNGQVSPKSARCRLAWRVFVAKIQSNRTFASEWLSVSENEVTSEEFAFGARRLFTSDGAGLDKLLRKKAGYCHDVISARERIAAGRISKKTLPLARAVLLRGLCNQAFLKLVRPWIAEAKKETAHGTT